MSLQEIAEEAVKRDARKVIIIDRWKGGPGRIRFYEVGEEGLTHISPQIYIKGIRLQREFKVKRRVIHSLMIRKLKRRHYDISKLLITFSDFFDIPVVDVEKVEKAYDAVMEFSHDIYNNIQISFFVLPQVVEIGPRVTISHVAW